MFSKKFKNNRIEYYIITLILSVFFFGFNNANAATLQINSNPVTLSPGSITTLSVVLNSEGVAINNAEAKIIFPTDLLEVVSVNKGNSIFSMWVEEPAYSNITGIVAFNGGIPTPGFTGSSGLAISVVVKAKKTGQADIIFSDAAVRANDGLGTNILNSKNGITIQIGISKEITVPVTATEKSAVPPKPVIVSETHPDQDLWYSLSTATFGWKIPSGIISLKTLFNRKPISTPTITYDNSVSQKTISNISDGTSYLHLRYLNSAGESLIAHYRINVDTTPPLSFIPTIRVEDGQSLIKLNAEDLTSGVDYYTIQIDDTDQILKIKSSELNNNEYILPILTEGNHNLIVTVYDKALNHTESILTFASPSISVPILSLSSNEITSGEVVTIFGRTKYPNNQVEITLESEGKEIDKYTQTISPDGSFSVTTDKIKKTGVINIWAETVFSEAVRSDRSEKLYLKVNEIEAVKMTLAVFYPLIGLIIILLLLIIITFLLYLGWHKFFGLKNKIKQELKTTTEEVHRNFLILKEEMNRQLAILEKIKEDRFLNDEEERAFGQIKSNIDSIDSFIENKINKIL